MVVDFLNLFAETEVTKQDDVTPSFNEGLSRALKGAQQETRVAMPATIVTYDYKTQKATVQPSLQRKYNDGKVLSMPQLYNVPVAHPRAGKAFVHIPLKKGDNVMLVFMDRSIDKWKGAGGEVEPSDARTHHLSDAVAYPGLYPLNTPADVPNGDDIIIRNGNTMMHVKANNHLQVINGTTELIKTLCDLVRSIRESVTYTCGGPQHLYHVDWPEIERRLKSFLEVT